MTSAQHTDWLLDVRASIKAADRDFHLVKPAIYWRDMAIGATIAYGSAAVFLGSPAFSPWQVIGYLVAVFWLYRVGSLVHEVCHLGRHECVPFKVAWNLFVGVPTLTPSTFFTGHHRDHHTQRFYSTPQDPEYVINVCPRGRIWNLIFYFSFVAIFPLLVFTRFILAPLTFITPGIRDFCLRRLSDSDSLAASNLARSTGNTKSRSTRSIASRLLRWNCCAVFAHGASRVQYFLALCRGHTWSNYTCWVRRC